MSLRVTCRIAPILGVATAWVAAEAQMSTNAAYLARVRSPGGAMTTPSLATIGNPATLGTGFHLNVGFGSETLTGVAYGAAFDFPAPASTRFGVTGGSVIGMCDERVQIRQFPCPVGYFLGVNAIGRFFGREVGTPSSRRVFAVGWSADVAYGHVEAQTSTAGFALPIMLSFRSTRRTSATEKDPRFNPHTAIFVEPGISIGQAKKKEMELGILPQLSAGVSVLDIGPGFGFSGTARKWSGTDRLRGALAVSWHSRSRPR